MDRKGKIQLLKDLQTGKKTLNDLNESSCRYSREDLSKLTWEEWEMLFVFYNNDRNSSLGLYPITDEMDLDEEIGKYFRYIDEVVKTRPVNYGGVVKVETV